MKVLVVGGAGYIGGAVTDALTAKNIPFTVYDNLTYELHYLKQVDFIRGDVQDTKLLGSILSAYTHVIWLAAIVGDGACDINPARTMLINNILVAWLSENFSGRVIFTSTCSVYGANDGLVDEQDVTNPLSLYAVTKLSAERYLERRGNSLIFRLGTAYGLSDTYSRPRMDLVVNQMAVSAATTGRLTLHGGDQWRPMIHVRDIARTIVNNLDGAVGIYNLATENLQMKTLADSCARITNCEIVVEPMKEDLRNYRADTSKALKDGVWQEPHFTAEYGIVQFVELIRSGRVTDANRSTYFNVKHLQEG
jgi:nucleoside-diphosphate-sugar epimerase